MSIPHQGPPVQPPHQGHQGPPSQPPADPTTLDPIPGIIAFGSLNILAGASGVGKTCLLATLLRSLLRGEDIFGRRVNPPPAIGLICADRNANVARQWLVRAECPPEVKLYALAEDEGFSLLRLRNKVQLVSVLEELVRKLELPPGSLLVVDPITLFLGNPNDYQGCAVACLEIRRMAKRLKITIIGTAHASKQKADAKSQYKRLQDRILGSAAQLGYGDTQMYLASPEETDEKFYTFLWHPHTEPPEIFSLGRTKNGLFVDYASSTQNEQEQKILTAIATGEEGSSFAEIVIGSEASKATVHRYLQELIQDGHVNKVGHGRYRRVPPN